MPAYLPRKSTMIKVNASLPSGDIGFLTDWLTVAAHSTLQMINVPLASVILRGVCREGLKNGDQNHAIKFLLPF